jgi:hypothetical protein
LTSEVQSVPAIDVHQHLWTAPLVEALSRRSEMPFVRFEYGLSVLYLAGERPYVIDLLAEAPERRAALVERDRLDGALLCLSSPLGIESLPRAEALSLIDAYHDGALSLGHPFGVWGAVTLDRLDPGDVDCALERGCVGVSLPAGALAGVDSLSPLGPLLERLESRRAPLFVHPGPCTPPPANATSLGDPLWWPALTRYVSEMHCAWLTFLTAARPAFPELRVVFSMLAGLAPLHAERLLSRGGPSLFAPDPLTFYETSSYGPAAVRALAAAIGGPEQLLYGSDRPIVDPGVHDSQDALDPDLLADGTRRALGPRLPVALGGGALELGSTFRRAVSSR